MSKTTTFSNSAPPTSPIDFPWPGGIAMLIHEPRAVMQLHQIPIVPLRQMTIRARFLREVTRSIAAARSGEGTMKVEVHK